MILKTTFIFILAGICEIGGGYLVWLWVKQGKPAWYAIAGSVVLIMYGFVATLQPANFARVYATYGGYFIIMSMIWSTVFDKFTPDKYDIIGALIVILGISIIYYGPRS
jgi:small multidrug resistance family-3 protein